MNNSTRSPSRDRVDRYAPHAEADGTVRQPRRYFRDHFWERWKVRSAVLLGGIAIAILSVKTLLPGTKSDYGYSHGPVAKVHAAWDNNCEACHKPHSTGDLNLSGVINPKDRWMDLTCQKCHAGPTHHTTMKWPADWPSENSDASCAACHHDHGGRANSLVAIADSHCTKCHANLADYHKEASLVYAKSVTNFHAESGGHPEFRKLDAEKKEPRERGLKFSHLHHMSPGIAYLAGGRGPMTKADLLKLNAADAAIVNRYVDEKETDSTMVQLKCESCHQLDAGRLKNDGRSNQFSFLQGEPRESILPPKAAGTYYLPINFEAHCSVCHPLKSPTLSTDVGQKLASFELPHRKQPDEMRSVLQARISAAVLNQKPKDVPGVGDVLNFDLKRRKDEDRVIDTKVGQQIAKAVDEAYDKLFAATNPQAKNAVTGSTCLECHTSTGDQIQPVRIPTVWFEHSKFSHASHRGVSCADCHPNTAPSESLKFDSAKLYTASDQKINILGVQSCRTCHTPSVGVRSGCVDCHAYHNSDHPFQGLGASSRDPAKPFGTAAEMLKGR